jgi:hypothetical protein
MKTFHLDTLPFLRKKLASPSLAARWQASGAGNHLSVASRNYWIHPLLHGIVRHSPGA